MTTSIRNNRLSTAWRWLARRPGTLVAVVVLLVVVFGITAGSALYPRDPNFQVLVDRFRVPSLQYPLGTDELGRDLLARVLAGARISLAASLMSMLVALAIGTPLGLISGYLKGPVDAVVSRFFDTLQIIPGLILLIALTGVLGRELRNVVLALGILFSIRLFRVVRAVTRSIATEVYIQASLAAGASMWHVVSRHILINALSPLVVQSTILIGWGVLAETGLSYLGLGVQPPDASLGSLLADGSVHMSSSPWMIITPGLMIFIVTVSIITLGDSLRDSIGRRSL